MYHYRKRINGCPKVVGEGSMNSKLIIIKSGLIIFILIFLSSWNVFAEDKYFPLDEGFTWNYTIKTDGKAHDETMVIKTLPKKYLLGSKLIPRQIETGGKKTFEFFDKNDEGVYVYAAQESGIAKPELKEKPYFYIKKPYRVGNTWEGHYKTKHLMEPVKFPIKVTIQSVDETVTVPAGKFSKCLKLTKTGEINENHGGYFGESKVIVEESLWYAPGVGLVKSEFNEMSNHRMSGPGHGTTLLESYKVNSKKNSLFW